MDDYRLNGPDAERPQLPMLWALSIKSGNIRSNVPLRKRYDLGEQSIAASATRPAESDSSGKAWRPSIRPVSGHPQREGLLDLKV